MASITGGSGCGTKSFTYTRGSGGCGMASGKNGIGTSSTFISISDDSGCTSGTITSTSGGGIGGTAI